MQDLHQLPKLRDSLSYVYVEHAVIERKESAVEAIQKDGRTLIPAAAVCVLMLGPGTSISHAAIKVLAESGCSVLWVGEDATRFYAQGLGETRKGFHLLHQAEMACNPEKHTQVVLAMYRMRFQQQLDPNLSLAQIRGLEGARVRQTYAQASRKYGVPWEGRSYDMQNWSKGDPINRALSAANALLNGVCHAAIVSGGYSAGLGFIHSGRQLSFVYDIADLYKVELTIPTAFETVAEDKSQVESRVRTACRQRFKDARLLERVLPDIDGLLGIKDNDDLAAEDAYPDLPALLWPDLQSEEVDAP